MTTPAKIPSFGELSQDSYQSDNIPPDLRLFSPAKINLFLHITARRDDGYHNLQSVFRLLDWGDFLHFWVSEDTFEPTQPIDKSNIPIELECSTDITDSPLDNLIVKAAIRLVECLCDPNFIRLHKSIKPLPEYLPVIKVKLDKKIPTGAGLGGGSSNAAITLLALNTLWDLALCKQTLIDIGAKVGADVPIFIAGGDSIVRGIGELITPIELPSQSYLLLTPNAHITTSELFAHPQLRRDCTVMSDNHINMHADDFIYRLRTPFYNVFEPVVSNLAEPVSEALTYLQSLETITDSSARMTGSGSSVFLPYRLEHLTTLQALTTKAPCPAIFVNNYHS